MRKHCFNSHFKNNYNDSTHLSCCHWNLGKVILVALQVTKKNILLETNTKAIQGIPGGKIQVHWLCKKVTEMN